MSDLEFCRQIMDWSIGQQLGYKRVSTTDQNTQRQLYGIKLDKIFTDFFTRKTLNRPKLNELMDHIRAGDTIWIDSLDRLACGALETLTIITKILSKQVRIIIVEHNMTLTPTNEGHVDPQTQTFLFISGLYAETELRTSKRRQREGINRAYERDVYKGRRPIIITDEMKTIINEGKKNNIPKTRIAKKIGTSRQTLYKLIEQI